MPTRLATALLLLLLALPLPGAHLGAQIPRAEYEARRQRLAAALDDGVLLALGAPEPAQDYLPFAQSPSFAYLTGVREPGAALVTVKRDGQVRSTLFVLPRDPEVEVWSGRRLGTTGATELTGLPARPAGELDAVLDSLLAGGGTLHVVGEVAAEDGILSRDEQLVQRLVGERPAVRVVPATPAVERLRASKSPAEMELIRKAAAITVDAHREVMRFIEPGQNEFEAQALIEYTFRRNGADRPAFASIVGSGPNATTLHYNDNDRFMQGGDLVVMDVGASYRGYAADVTRTVPVDGTFSAEERAVYDLVRAAQAAAERQARPGAPARLMMDSAAAVIAEGLARLGLTEGPDATYDCAIDGRTAECPQWRLYFMHGLGHGIGLEVHDPDQYYFTGRLAPGSAFTIEPGVYVRANLLDILPQTPRNRRLAERIRPAVERYRNVGVRIEDDYLVTEQGLEWISRAPREAEEIEALMRDPWTGPMPRRPEVVDWYRQPR